MNTDQIIDEYRKATGKEPTQEEIDQLKGRMVMGVDHGKPGDDKTARAIITPDADLVNADWPKRTQDVKLSNVEHK
jgi:hypothetical protein